MDVLSGSGGCLHGLLLRAGCSRPERDPAPLRHQQLQIPVAFPLRLDLRCKKHGRGKVRICKARIDASGQILREFHQIQGAKKKHPSSPSRHSKAGPFRLVGGGTVSEQCKGSLLFSTSVSCTQIRALPGNGAVLSKEQESEAPKQRKDGIQRKLLCLSNGHGEDAIAVAILKELKAVAATHGVDLLVDALPLVGLGTAYTRTSIRTVGPAQVMPSGGFLYMDRLQLVGDLRAGLLALTWEQWRTISGWTEEHGANAAILAVGDIVPLAFAWLASQRVQSHGLLDYAFVGTAKSEFYIRTVEGEKMRPERRDLLEAWLSPSCVYLPWERALMANSRCQLVAPRDGLTAEVLRQELPPPARWKVVDLGNPMMDNLEPTGGLNSLVKELAPSHSLVLLPGSRPPEVHANFLTLLAAADSTARAFNPERVLFLAPIVPSLELGPFLKILADSGWQRRAPQPFLSQQVEAQKAEPAGGFWGLLGRLKREENKGTSKAGSKTGQESRLSKGVQVKVAGGGASTGNEAGGSHSGTLLEIGAPSGGASEGSGKGQSENGKGLQVLLFESEKDDGRGGAILALVTGGFNDCSHWAEAGVAMAGTATEQLVGLGKPAFTLPGRGPQFTYAFAEAQSRLLGESVILCQDVAALGFVIRDMLKSKEKLNAIAENGYRRMGPSGAAARIAESLWGTLFND